MIQIKTMQLWLRRLGAAIIDWPISCIVGLLLCSLPVFPGTLGVALGVSFYFALFECSKLQATPGKFLFELKVTDVHGNSISIWQAFLVRLLQLFLIALLIIAASVVESLEVLCGWNMSWGLIFAILSGLVLLSYLIFPKFYNHLPFTDNESTRLVLPRTKDSVQGKANSWSIKQAIAFNLHKGEVIYAATGLLLWTALPYANQSFVDFTYNKAGVAKAPVVYAVVDIPENKIITKDELEITEIAKQKIPQDAATSMGKVSGHKCKFRVPAGKIISLHDIEPIASTRR